MTDNIAKLFVTFAIILIFAGAGATAYFTDNHDLLVAWSGAAINSLATVVGYWLGSSQSSAKKDDALAASVVPK